MSGESNVTALILGSVVLFFLCALVLKWRLDRDVHAHRPPPRHRKPRP